MVFIKRTELSAYGDCGLLIRRVDAGDAEIPEFLLVAVPGEEQMAIGRGAMEDEAVRIHRKTGGAELWKIVE